MDRAERVCIGLLLLFGLDRLLRLAALRHFFRHPQAGPRQVGPWPAAPPARWPGVTILQPVTRGAHGLAHNLGSRFRLDYPAPIQYLFICDQADLASQAVCRAVSAAAPAASTELILVDSRPGALATKIEKLCAALPRASGEILCFLDDDVALRPGALRDLIPYLDQPRAGAAFGLACHTNWRTLGSSALSAFVNTNALLSYVPLTYLSEPFTITGHCFALRRAVFDAIGGLDGMAGRIDDDHELARRLRRHNLRSMQTPLVYDVDNDLPSLRAYLAQMQRWFVLPRLLMLPHLTRRDQMITALGGLGNLLPPLIALAALMARSRRSLLALLALLGIIGGAYVHGERRYLGRTTPLSRLALVPLVALAAPLQIGWALLVGDEVQWRGQRLRFGVNGVIEVLR